MEDVLNIALSNAIAAAVLALLAAAVGAVCRRPALVHGLWLLVLLKLVTPPLLRIPIDWPQKVEPAPPTLAAALPEEPQAEIASSPQPEEPAVLVTLPAVEDEPATAAEFSPALVAPTPADAPLWPRVLRLVWIAGALGWFGLALVRLARFGRLLHFAQPAPSALQERTRQLAQRLGLRRCPRVGLLPGRIAPMLWAIGPSPRLLVPAELLDLLGADELDTLLVHELAHLRRRDHWVRVLEFAVLGLYWWHPVVWYARRELREAEEQCCDAWVVSTLPGAGRTYATALMDTLDFLASTRPAAPPLASGLGQISDLKRRLTMIMRGTTPRALSWPGCLLVLSLGAFLLPLLPALQGQTPPGKEEQERKSVTIRLDRQVAETEVERTKALLQQAEADLQKKMAEVAAAKARLEAAAAQARARAQLEKALKEKEYRLTIERAKLKKGDEADKRPMVRIEILLPAGEDVNVKDVLKKIEKALPDAKIGRVIKGAPGEIFGAGPNNLTPAPAIYYQGKKIVKPKPGEAAASQDKQNKRIDDLEKKLEKVLHELQQMRKQMREPNPGAQAVPTPQSNLAPLGLYRPNPSLDAIPAPNHRVPSDRPGYNAPTVPLTRPEPNAPVGR